MIRYVLLVAYLTILLPPTSSAAIVPSVTEVYAGSIFSITATVYGAHEAFEIRLHPFLELVPGDDAAQFGDALRFRAVDGPGPTTLYALLHVLEGAQPADITWPGGQVTRICCVDGSAPRIKQYLPAQLH